MHLRTTHVQTRQARVRHRPAERTHEHDAAHARLPGKAEHAAAERLPLQVRLAADEQHDVRIRIAEERVGGPVELLHQAVFDLHVRTEHGRHFHGAGHVVDVERLRIDLGDGLCPQQRNQVLHRAGGHVAAVHPAGEGQHERTAVERQRSVDLQQIAFTHDSVTCCVAPVPRSAGTSDRRSAPPRAGKSRPAIGRYRGGS